MGAWVTIEDEGRGVVRLQVNRATSGRMDGRVDGRERLEGGQEPRGACVRGGGSHVHPCLPADVLNCLPSGCNSVLESYRLNQQKGTTSKMGGLPPISQSGVAQAYQAPPPSL